MRKMRTGLTRQDVHSKIGKHGLEILQNASSKISKTRTKKLGRTRTQKLAKRGLKKFVKSGLENRMNTKIAFSNFQKQISIAFIWHEGEFLK